MKRNNTLYAHSQINDDTLPGYYPYAVRWVGASYEHTEERDFMSRRQDDRSEQVERSA